jgi:hypothetical protein
VDVNATDYSGLEDRNEAGAIALVDQAAKDFSNMMPPRNLSYLRVVRLYGGLLSFTALQDPCAVSDSTIAAAESLPSWDNALFSSPALDLRLPRSWCLTEGGRR